MFEISIDKYTLVGILSIAFILLIAMILIFIAFMCHDKRRYKSIDKYNEQTLSNSKSYNENLEEYNKNIERSGVNLDKKSKLNFRQSVINFFKRDSK